jgi:hypothetical protein
LRHDRIPVSVLLEQGGMAGLNVHDPDVSVVGCEKIDDLRSDLTAEIGRIPDEIPACPEEFARLFTGNLHNQSLIPRWSGFEFRANRIKGDLREIGQVPRNPRILA